MVQNTRAFRKGLMQLRVKDVAAAKADIMQAMGITTKQSFIRYADGRAKLDVIKAQQIEDIFRQYGVTDCWGTA